MGEILRAAAVTGTRKLDAVRVEPRRNEADERVTAVKGGTRKPSRDAAAGQPREEPAFSAPAAPAAPVPPDPAQALSTELARTRDLADIQEKRIAQLETENATVSGRLEALGARHATLEEQLRKDTESGHSRGYEDGVAAAREDLARELKKQAADLQQLQRLFSTSLEGQLAQVDEYAVDIAFAALARLIGDRLGEEGFTRALVTHALSTVRGARKVAVHVSQQDFKVMGRLGEELGADGRFSEIEFVPDPRVTVGGCMIETDTGVWDARLETQLQRLRDAIDSSVKSGS
jgi:flagellar biosynthesis/type III secretory pathway protein FliH